MHRLTRLSCVLSVMSAISLLSACSREANIKIGVAAPMSGDLAQYGKDIAHGAEIAAAEFS